MKLYMNGEDALYLCWSVEEFHYDFHSHIAYSLLLIGIEICE